MFNVSKTTFYSPEPHSGECFFMPSAKVRQVKIVIIFSFYIFLVVTPPDYSLISGVCQTPLSVSFFAFQVDIIHRSVFVCLCFHFAFNFIRISFAS